jgi:hypothetical protein
LKACSKGGDQDLEEPGPPYEAEQAGRASLSMNDDDVLKLTEIVKDIQESMSSKICIINYVKYCFY